MTELLPSWRDTPTRQAILSFLAAVSDAASADFVSPAERVAVFDNDGTLWAEKPMPTQLHYLLEQWRAAADAEPALAETQPYRAAVTGDYAWLGGAIDKHYAGDDSDLGLLIAAVSRVSAGVGVDEYAASVREFFAHARHPILGVPYAQTVYRPMLELLRLLEQHDFRTYIVSGGERDFMRPITAELYGVPPQRVVGTAMGMSYDAEANSVRYSASLAFFNDGPEKPIRIWDRVGRRPILAAGNSDGDLPMLHFAQGSALGLALLVSHDDPERGDIPYVKGAEKALATAEDSGLTVISVRDDWATVFPSPER